MSGCSAVDFVSNTRCRTAVSGQHLDSEQAKMTSATPSATGQQDEQPKRRVYGRPFPKGVSQSHQFMATRKQMEAEVIADLERDGRKVTSADRLLVARYVELLRSRSHSDTNTALKVWTALAEKYATQQPGMTLERYAALHARKDVAE
jgi:hypothetical protein